VRHVAVADEAEERGAIDRQLDVGVSAQRGELRAEHEQPAVAGPAEVQRLLAEAIAGQGQRAIARVPHREREHPAQARQRGGHAPGLDRRQQDLGVGAAAEPRAASGQLGAQLAVVVDLAVEGDRQVARGRGHRLVAGRRQIDDCQAAEAQANRAVGPRAAVVGAARRERRGHRAGQGLTARAIHAVGVDEAGDAAHRAWW
jgi:hypothetical protein